MSSFVRITGDFLLTAPTENGLNLFSSLVIIPHYREQLEYRKNVTVYENGRRSYISLPCFHSTEAIMVCFEFRHPITILIWILSRK